MDADDASPPPAPDASSSLQASPRDSGTGSPTVAPQMTSLTASEHATAEEEVEEPQKQGSALTPLTQYLGDAAEDTPQRKPPIHRHTMSAGETAAPRLAAASQTTPLHINAANEQELSELSSMTRQETQNPLINVSGGDSSSAAAEAKGTMSPIRSLYEGIAAREDLVARFEELVVQQRGRHEAELAASTKALREQHGEVVDEVREREIAARVEAGVLRSQLSKTRRKACLLICCLGVVAVVILCVILYYSGLGKVIWDDIIASLDTTKNRRLRRRLSLTAGIQ